MNLVSNLWLPVSGGNKKVLRVTPAGVGSVEKPLVDIFAPRPDFRAALYQFLIGLLQTGYAPEDWAEWRERWETPPGEEDLAAALAPLREAFELDSAGPAFMQDLDPLASTTPCGIGGLLIDAPGENTVNLNKDHFIHREGVCGMCLACSATALFTLQINAPSGGAGHRVSLRGGGPLTTLRVPSALDATLWQKLWANVVPQECLSHPPVLQLSKVFPWLTATRTSDAAGMGTTEPGPKVAHELQAYWSMPRRVRLDFSAVAAGTCDLCGESTDRLVRQYRTLNYGVNYAGAWQHPLTPYNFDPKQNDLPISLKGQRGGIGYRHWLALTLGGSTIRPAAVLSAFGNAQRKLPVAAQDARLWVCGFDMDNAKARCWYDATLPLYGTAQESSAAFRVVVEKLAAVAEESARALNRSVKEAASNRPADRESDPAVAQSFWQGSEAPFYRMLQQVADANLDDSAAVATLYEQWLRTVRHTALTLFDRWVIAVPIEEMKMSRVVTAKANLGKALYKGTAAELDRKILAEKEAAA